VGVVEKGVSPIALAHRNRLIFYKKIFMYVPIWPDFDQSSHVTSLQTPKNWHVYIEGQRRKQKNNAAACSKFLSYLTFLLLAADRADSILPVL
jgi:hypothetical protein